MELITSLPRRQQDLASSMGDDELADNIEGAVGRETVIKVLIAHGVSVAIQEGGRDGMVVLAKDTAKGTVVEVMRIPQVVRKTLLRHLERRFEIPLTRFYYPHPIQ
jgi:hypothetical protein